MQPIEHAADEIDALVLPAWRVLGVDPTRLGEAAAALRQAAGPTAQRARIDAFADMFEARWLLARGQVDEAQRLGELALARARACDAADAQAASVDLLAAAALQQGQLEHARAAVQPWLTRLERAGEPLGSTWAILRYLMTTRVAIACERAGNAYEALGPSYACIDAARATGLAPYVARALAGTGGLQSSLFNLEDAFTLCSEAWQLCAPERWFGCISMAGPNLMLALRGLGRLDEARTLTHTLIELEPNLTPVVSAQRKGLYAVALAAAGEHAQAQVWLDESRAEQPPGAPPRCEWVWTQAGVWLHADRARDALELIEQQWARGEQVRSSRFPVDDFELQRVAARACEALGDFRRALVHEREAASAREQAMRMAAQARQRTLQVQHELASIRQQRDQAWQEQQRLAQLNEQLAQTSAAKTRFLATASHDLRQPLHALTLQAAALRAHVHEAEPAQLLGAVERCATSLTTMFDALLDLTRADMGVLEPQPRAFDLAALLADLVDQHRTAAATKGLRLALRTVRRGAAGHDAFSDPQLFTALVRNLLVNALRYTEAGAVLVCLRRAQEYGSPGGWRVQVRDSGVGIAPEHQARVFEEFYQVGNSERRTGQGLGLGLTIAERLARLLGHPLVLRSAPGRGTCFELRVPAGRGAATPTVEAAPAPQLAGLRLAVLEDEPEAAAALAALLRQWGAAVDTFDTAGALMQHAARHGPPQALLADHHLPGATSGADAAALLRARGAPALPVLMLTADASPVLAQQLRLAGLAQLPKPVPLAQLARWLREMERTVRQEPLVDR